MAVSPIKAKLPCDAAICITLRELQKKERQLAFNQPDDQEQDHRTDHGNLLD
jgi:hypothetical protein